MKTAKARMIFDFLRIAVLPRDVGLTDGQLLRQYFAHRDEAAFALLVRRHGPMVLAVCRRLLRLAEDAEDAFQAAFVILARKGRCVSGQQTIGGWLHGVAYRVALDVRRRGARRQAKEQQVEIMPQPTVMPKEDQSELLAVLDRELARLPEKYRVPVVLCELEGRSRKEAARQLGLAEGTLSSRLATARKTLAKRMAGQGAAVAGASLTALFASQAGAAVVPGPLVASTIRAAGGVVSAGVVALAEGVLKAMLLTKIKGAALVLLLASAVGVGGVTLTYRAAAQGPGDTAEKEPPRNAASLPGLSKAGNPEISDLQALQQEVAALRANLKALEAEVHGKRATSSPNPFQPSSPLLPDPRVPREPYIAAPLDPTPRLPLDAPGEKQASKTAPVPLSGPTVPPAESNEGRPYPPTPNTSTPAPAAPAGPQFPPASGLPPTDANPGVKATRETAEAKVQEAAALLANHPTNKQLQEAAKQAVEQLNSQLNSPENKVKKAAAFLMKRPQDEEAQNGLKEALEELNRSTQPKTTAPER